LFNTLKEALAQELLAKSMMIWTWETNEKGRSFYEKMGGKWISKHFVNEKYTSVSYAIKF
jgi:hypothetical protein